MILKWRQMPKNIITKKEREMGNEIKTKTVDVAIGAIHKESEKMDSKITGNSSVNTKSYLAYLINYFPTPIVITTTRLQQSLKIFID